MMPNVESLVASRESSVRDIMTCIDKNARGAVVIVDAERRLQGIVTDGDLRRAVLADVQLDAPIDVILEDKRRRLVDEPVTAPVGTPDEQVLALMRAHTLRHIPIVDEQRRVIDVRILDDLLSGQELALTAVVVVGGTGSRLYPLTKDTPKPMLPVGDRPLLELIVDQLRRAGISRLNLTTHYRSDVISDHFGDGRAFGVDIAYVHEDSPLGTAGALSRLKAQSDPILVMNGDILTGVDFRALLDFHREHNAEMTIAVWSQEIQVPYGVVETNGPQVIRIVEKPVIKHFISAGVYLLNPDVCSLVPCNEPYDMPDLIGALLADGRRVISFPIREYWRDIGKPEDYGRAIADVREGVV